MSQRRPTEAEIRDARRLLGVGPGAPQATILKAWREAVRRNHPDAAPESERGRAEALCSRINAAKDMLLQFPGGAPGTNGNGRPATASSRPASPVSRTASQPARPATGTAARSGPSGYVPTGVREGDALTPPRTGLLLTFLVVGSLALLSILAITTHDEEDAASSRIGSGSSGSSQVSASTLTPRDEMATLLTGADVDSRYVDQLTAPETRLADLDDIVSRVHQVDPGVRALAHATTRCETFQPGIPDRASCAVEDPADLLPYPVEFRRDGQGWHLYGYRRGG